MSPVCSVMALWVWLVVNVSSDGTVGVVNVSSDGAVGVVSCGCVQ